MVRAFIGLVIAAFALAWAQTAAAAPAAPIEAYGKLPDMEDVRLSPSGKRLAMVKVVGDERRLLVIETAGKVLVNAAIGDSKLSGIDWASDDYLLVTKRETVDGGIDFGWNNLELAAVLVLDLKQGKQFWVFKRGDRTGAVLGSYGVRQVNGKWFGYFGGREEITQPNSLFEVDFTTGKFRKIRTGSDHYWNRWLVGVDGKLAAYSEYLDSTGDWDLFLGESRRRIMSVKNLDDSPSLGGFGRTHDTALVWQDNGKGTEAWEVSLTTDRPPERLSPDVAVRGGIRNNQGLLIGFSTWDRKLKFFDPAHQARWNGARKAFAGYEVTLLGATDDLNTMVVYTDGKDDSGTYWLVEIRTGDARPIGRAYPTIEPALVGPTRMVRYRAADGLEMDGVLTLPPGREAKNLPVIIMPHGGPITSGDGVGFYWKAQAFAARGYAVFQPNFRGTLGYGAAFERAAYGEWGKKMQSDLSDGLAELARLGIVDPKRACIVGASYGGYAALAGVTLQNGIYRCAVSSNGVGDLKDMLKETAGRSGRRSEEMRWWRKLMGVQSGSDGVLIPLSPERQASKADAPILLVYSKDDTVVPPAQSLEMEKALRAAGKPVEVIALDGEDHWMSRGATRLAMLRAAIAFVEKHNPPD